MRWKRCKSMRLRTRIVLLHDGILDVNRAGGVLSRVEYKHMIDNELSRIIIIYLGIFIDLFTS